MAQYNATDCKVEIWNGQEWKEIDGSITVEVQPEDLQVEVPDLPECEITVTIDEWGEVVRTASGKQIVAVPRLG